MKKILISLLLCSFYSTAFASGASGFREIVKIDQRECQTDKGFEIHLKTGHDNPDGCTSNMSVDVSCTHTAYNTIVSMAMMAFAADKKVQFWLNSCGNDGQAKVITLAVEK